MKISTYRPPRCDTSLPRASRWLASTSQNETCFAPADNAPLRTTSESADAPANGPDAATAYCFMRLSASRVAPAIADIALAVAQEPPDTGPAGNAELPSSTSTLSSGSPVSSPTVCATIVYVPVPMSCKPHCASAVPSARNVTRASVATRKASQLHAPIP